MVTALVSILSCDLCGVTQHALLPPVPKAENESAQVSPSRTIFVKCSFLMMIRFCNSNEQTFVTHQLYFSASFKDAPGSTKHHFELVAVNRGLSMIVLSLGS